MDELEVVRFPSQDEEAEKTRSGCSWTYGIRSRGRDFLYFGHTTRPVEVRFDEHRNGKGAELFKDKYEVGDLVYRKLHRTRKDAAWDEFKQTVINMKRFGYDHVRGGPFLQPTVLIGVAKDLVDRYHAKFAEFSNDEGCYVYVLNAAAKGKYFVVPRVELFSGDVELLAGGLVERTKTKPKTIEARYGPLSGQQALLLEMEISLIYAQKDPHSVLGGVFYEGFEKNTSEMNFFPFFVREFVPFPAAAAAAATEEVATPPRPPKSASTIREEVAPPSIVCKNGPTHRVVKAKRGNPTPSQTLFYWKCTNSKCRANYDFFVANIY